MGEEFVRIRPQTTGFKAEAESGVKSGMSGIGKIIGGALAVGGVVEGVKKLVTAAASENAAFQMMDKTIANAGLSNQVYGKSVNDVIKAEALHSGFMTTDVIGAFTRISVGAKTTNEAYHNLGLAEDIARFKHMDLAQAGTLLAKVEQGVTTGLARVGIILPKTTAGVDALKTAHDKAVASGTKFTKQQELQYKNSLEVAKASDKEASKTAALAALQQKVGGLAAEYAASDAGKFDKAKVSIHEMEVELGDKLLPVAANAAAGVAKYATELGHSSEMQSAFSAGAHDVASVFGVVRSVIETVGPPLLMIVQEGMQVASVIGSPAILTAIGTYKGLAIATGLAATAQEFYARTVAAGAATSVGGAAANSALAASAGAVTIAEGAEAAMIERGVSANIAATLGAAQLTAANAGLAASEIAAGAAGAGEGAGGIAAFGTGLASMISPTTALIAGGALLAGGIAAITYHFLDQKSAADLLRDSLNQLKDAEKGLTDEAAVVTTDRLAAGTAKLGIERAKLTLSTSDAKKGSLAYQEEQHAVLVAEDQWRQSNRQLQEDLGKYKTKAYDAGTATGVFGGNVMSMIGDMANAGASSSSAAAAIDKQSAAIKKTNPVFSNTLHLISQYIGSLKNLNQIDLKKLFLLIDNTSAKKTLDDFPGVVQSGVARAIAVASSGGYQLGVSLGQGLGHGIAAEKAVTAEAAFALVAGAISSARAAAGNPHSPAPATIPLGKDLAEGIGYGFVSFGETVKASVHSSIASTISSAKTQIAQAKTQMKTDVAQAVTDAKSNLTSIGGSLSGTIGTALDKRASAATGALANTPEALRIKAINDQLAAEQTANQQAQLEKALADAQAGSTSETTSATGAVIPVGTVDPAEVQAAQQALDDWKLQQEAATLQTGLDQQAAAIQATDDMKKASTEQGIADLTDELNRGLITRTTFQTELLKILQDDQVNYSDLGTSYGVAFADNFKAQLAGLMGQADALVATPDKTKGTASSYTVSVVKPLNAIHAGTKAIEKAVREGNTAIEKAVRADKHIHFTGKNDATIDTVAASADR